MPEVFASTKHKPKSSPEKSPTLQKIHRHVDEYSQVMRNELPCPNPYATFAPKPLDMSFQSQNSDEHIILMVRRHPITNLKWILIAIALSLFPLLANSVPFLSPLPPNFQLMALIFWYMLIFGFVIESYLSWFFQVNILTDERIIDIDFYSLLHKRISAAKIEKIEDVTSSMGGFIGSLFNYGNVEIQTAAEQREFIFDLVPQPEKITLLVNELILEEEREQIENRVN